MALWDTNDLAHACDIAAKMAEKEPSPNPMFVEALKVAAECFRNAVGSARHDGLALLVPDKVRMKSKKASA